MKHFRPLAILLTLAALLAQYIVIPSQAHAEISASAVSPNWYTATVDEGEGGLTAGTRPSIAINPVNQRPYISSFDESKGKLRISYQNGTNLSTNCPGAPTIGPLVGWTCSSLADWNPIGHESSIAFEPGGGGKFSVLYTQPSHGQLHLNRYDSNAILESHTTHASDGPYTDEARFPSLVYNGSKTIIGFYRFEKTYDDTYRTSVKTYQTPGDGVTNVWGGAVEDIDQASATPLTLGYHLSIDLAYDKTTPDIVYRGSGSGQLKFAHNMAGNSTSGCAQTMGEFSPKAWQCGVIDPTPLTGYYIDYHAPDSADDMRRIAYYDDTNKTVKTAVYTGNLEWSCGGAKGWVCQTIDTVAKGHDASGMDVSLAMINGKPVVAYTDKDDQANTILKFARYVGANGNCGLNGGIMRWECEVVDDGGGSANVGRDLDMAVDKNGIAYIAYRNESVQSLKLAKGKASAPLFTKTYTPSTVAASGLTTMAYAITNTSGSTITGLTFKDWLSSGIKIAPTPNMNNSCKGTIQLTENTIQLTSGSLQPQQTCVVTVQAVAPPWPVGVETWGLKLTSDNAATAEAPVAKLTVTEKAKQSQSITFTPIPDKFVGDPAFQVHATASSNLPVTFTASGACSVTGNTVTLSGLVGGCTVTAHQSGNEQYAEAPNMAAIFAINKRSQTLTFATLPNKIVGDAPFTVSATASSGLPVTFTTNGNCSISGATITLSGAGSCTVIANQAGNEQYKAALPVSRSFAINDPAKQNQTITFNALADRTVGDAPFTVSATTTSGLQVTFAATGKCSISGNKVTLSGEAGSCTITAKQAGNAQYNAAADVAWMFQIKALAKHAIFLPMTMK